MPSARAHSLSILLVALLALPVLAAPARTQTLAITGATIIDGTSKPPVSNGTVLITDGRIAAVGRAEDIAIPRAAKRLDARGKYAIPGLMDANIHLMNVDLETLIKYEDRFHEIVLEAAQLALKAGLTTVFDTWGPLAATVKARDMINAREAPGSRVYLAGNIIGFDGLFSPDFFADRAPYVSKTFVKRINETWQQGVGRDVMWLTEEEIRPVIRDYIGKGVDFLKYGAAGHHQFAIFTTFSAGVQRAIVEEGHRAGKTVQVHSGPVENIETVIAAGVDLITHGDLSGPKPIPEQTIRRLIERGIAVSVLPMTERHLAAREKLNPEANKSYRVAKTNRSNMIKAGVTVLLSTDAWLQDPALVEESPTREADVIDPPWAMGEGHFNALAALEEEGMAPMELLKSITSNIARAYKVDANLGTLETGKIADLVLLDRDPLQSARNYRSIHAVIKEGTPVDLKALPVAPLITKRPGGS